MIQVEFETRPVGSMATLGEVLDGSRSIRLDNAFPRPSGDCELVVTVVDDEEDVPALLEDESGITVLDASQRGSHPERYHLFVLAAEGKPTVLETLLSAEAIPNEIRLEDDHVVAGATVHDWTHLKALGSAVEETLGRFELRSVTETEHAHSPFGGGLLTDAIEGKLSEEQLRVLELAFERGFFDLPRLATESDLADELGVSQSTVSERLRSAQQSLLGVVLGEA